MSVGRESESFEVRRALPTDWAEYRHIRLAMLRDSPSAFAEKAERAERMTEREWRSRLARNSGLAVTAVAESSSGWIGTASAYRRFGGTTLVAVYVDPQHRGRQSGVIDALLDFVEAWARARASRITLDVNADNHRARRAYERRGYQLTGRASDHPHAPGEHEVQMQKRLQRPGAQR